MLLRTLNAEALKLKRTVALKMVFLAPIAVVLLTLFMASQAPFTTLHRNQSTNEWNALTRVNLQFWGMLMLPLYLTLETALTSGLDHTDNQWKALFARPVPRWTIYLSKLLVVLTMAVISAIILIVGMLAEGAALHEFDSQLRFGFPAPAGMMIQQTGQMTGLAFLYLTVLHWVSLRWRSFSVALGFGILAIVTSFAMLLAAGQYGAWPQYFPWALPMLVVAKQAQNVELALWISGGLGIMIVWVGCRDFCRQEIT